MTTIRSRPTRHTTQQLRRQTDETLVRIQVQAQEHLFAIRTPRWAEIEPTHLSSSAIYP